MEQAYPGIVGDTATVNLNGELFSCYLINGEYVYQGDIILGSTLKGAAIEDLNKRWPCNTVYYTIDSNFPDIYRIHDAISDYENRTNLTFKERTIDNPNYIEFISDNVGSSSYVGMIGGKQEVKIKKDGTVGTVRHEIGHAIGLWHEHSKPKRDDYIIVYEKNIEKGKEDNFKNHPSSLFTPGFDFESMMLYDSYAFAKEGFVTILKLDGETYTVSAERRFSADDIVMIYQIYYDEKIEHFTDSRDGHVYKTIKIGTQTWMAENLAYHPWISSHSDGSTTTPYYYVYDLATYGVLYNRSAASTACPAGWHLPSDAEWTTLSDYLGGESVAGGKLKEEGTTHWESPNTDATNCSFFSALPAGYRSTGGGFFYIGKFGYWWSSTQKSTDSAWFWYVSYNLNNIRRSYSYREDSFSIRCVKD